MPSMNRSDNRIARKRAKTNTRSTRAVLQLPVSRIHNKLKNGIYSSCNRGQGGALYTIAVFEYLSAFVLESPARAAEHNKRTRMSPRYIMLAIRNNIELSKMLKDVIIS